MSDDQSQNQPVFKVFVGNISWGVDNDMLVSHFEQVGEVVNAFVVKDRETGRSRGFGFVEFTTQEAADKAVETLNDSELDGRPIRVDHAEAKS